MAVIYVPHFVQFFDNNGNPLSGGRLFTYVAGTTTPKATFTAEDGLTPNANPIVLDSSGRATLFIQGAYKFRLETSAGVLVRETDNVQSFEIAGAATGAINWATADTIPSAASIDLGAATSNYVIITGTTTITSLGTVAQGAERLLRFTGSLTLTHNATSLILPNGANITTAAGDFARFISEGSGNWRLSEYQAFNSEATVASAATVNLGEQSSPVVNITGTTTITSFGAAAAGVRREIRPQGVFTITHNATSLITPSGANITTAVGQVYWAHSLGGGNWRIDNPSPVIDTIGVGQTWQAVTRIKGTTYTNSTGKPILLLLDAISVAGTITMTIAGTLVSTYTNPSGVGGGGTWIIPNGATYVYGGTGSANFSELR